MVFDGRDDDLISFSNECTSVRIGNQVDTFRNAPGQEYDFLFGRSIDKLPGCFSCILKCACCFFSECMNAPVDIGVVAFVIINQSFYDPLWLLCCRRVVQVNQVATINLLMKYRKLLPDL